MSVIKQYSVQATAVNPGHILLWARNQSRTFIGLAKKDERPRVEKPLPN
jgi:hypothetical protein